jgi:hypothetical protein
MTKLPKLLISGAVTALIAGLGGAGYLKNMAKSLTAKSLNPGSSSAVEKLVDGVMPNSAAKNASGAPGSSAGMQNRIEGALVNPAQKNASGAAGSAAIQKLVKNAMANPELRNVNTTGSTAAMQKIVNDAKASPGVIQVVPGAPIK